MAYTNVWTTAAPLDTQAANQGAADFRVTKLDVMQRIASFGAGLFANRPTPEVTSASANWTGVMYWATDTKQTFRWNGSSWDDISGDIPSSIADFLATSGSPVDVVSAAPPTTGQALTATDATHATWQDIVASALATSGASVDVSAAAPPSAGQVLTATDATHATWQTETIPSKPTITLKVGSNAGAYTTSSGSYVDVDSTNLSYTVVIPVGWKLAVWASGVIFDNTGPEISAIAISDGGTPLIAGEYEVSGGGAPSIRAFSLSYVINGDGASHTIRLQFLKVSGTVATIVNASGFFPSMTFMLTESN